MEIIQILTNILRVAPDIIILAFCIQYAQARKTTDGILLTIGSAIGCLVMIFWTFIYTYLYDSNLFSDREMMFTAIGFVGWTGQILFAIGLILLIRKAIRNWKVKTASTSFTNDPEAPLDADIR
jgi:uncharacterized membrane protein YedE/YeeE